MTLKEFRDLTKDFNDEIAEQTLLAIGIRDEKDIIKDDTYVSFPKFIEGYNVNEVNLIAEGTMAPKLFFIGIKK
jgi:hypothetical protein